MTADLISRCDDYLAARTGRYEWRAIRYRAAAGRMCITRGLDHTDTVVDVGAGWTELDYCLRAEFGWRGRYMPVDGGLDGTDLEVWTPPRPAEWFIALEVVEHLRNWRSLVGVMQAACTKGVVISTPNPETTDVLGMDDTHVVEVSRDDLEALGFTVREAAFYGQARDSLLAWWVRP